MRGCLKKQLFENNAYLFLTIENHDIKKIMPLFEILIQTSERLQSAFSRNFDMNLRPNGPIIQDQSK